jgi:predicted patatin/cPLA2 family phospholipase
MVIVELMSKWALILQGGTMRGAFLVGAMKTIYRLLGINYFDAIFATSVGVFEQAFFATNQINIMENTWREYVHGNQLINFINPLSGKPILNLDYLINLFKSEKSMLDIDVLNESHLKLITFITDHETREPVAMDLKENPFEIMRATCALPIFYPPKVIINNRRYVDCWLAPKQKFQKVLLENIKEYDNILVVTVYNKQDDFLDNIGKVIRPHKVSLWGVLDTNRKRIIETIAQGEKDAEQFLVNDKTFLLEQFLS